MPIVSACPKCDAAVLIPDGVGPQAKAKCPLCEEQFELEALFSALPPMLEIIGQPTRPAPLLAAANKAGASAVGDDESAHESDDGMLEFGSGVFGGIRADEESESPAEGELELEHTAESTDEAADSGSGFASIDFGEMSNDDADGAGAGTSTAVEGGFLDTSSNAAPVSLASKPRPKKKGPSPIFHILGIAGFGMVGLLIGYTILLMIKGPEGDFAGIGRYFPSFIYADQGGDTSNGGSTVADNSSNKSSQNSNKNGKNKKSDAQPNFKKDDSQELSALPFDFGDSTDKSNSIDQAQGEPVGPIALKPTSRDDIADALGEVSVKAAKLAALQAVAKAQSNDSEEENNRELSLAIRDHYVALGTLGLTIASAKQGALDDADLRERIKQYLQNAVSRVDTFDEIGKKAAIWIDYKKVIDDEGNVIKKGRNGRDGVLIAGIITSIGLEAPQPNKPNLYSATMKIADSDKSVVVVGSGNPPVAGRRILVLGAIVENPQENLAGYSGDEETVVLQGFVADATQNDELIIDDQKTAEGTAQPKPPANRATAPKKSDAKPKTKKAPKTKPKSKPEAKPKPESEPRTEPVTNPASSPEPKTAPEPEATKIPDIELPKFD